MIAHLKLQIAKLRREQCGPSAERTRRLLEQMELQLDDLEADAAEDDLAAEAAAAKTSAVATFERKRPARKPFARLAGRDLATRTCERWRSAGKCLPPHRGKACYDCKMTKRDKRCAALALLIEQPAALAASLIRVETWVAEVAGAEPLTLPPDLIKDFELLIAHCRATSDGIILHAIDGRGRAN